MDNMTNQKNNQQQQPLQVHSIFSILAYAQQQPLQSFSTTLLLKHGRSNTSPIRTMTNGSIMQNHSINMNRMYNSLPGHTATTTTSNGNGNGEVNGNNVTSPPNGAPPFEVRTLAMIRAK